mmetsp:Transcript_48351/g.114648  ORF Transcript_48351/g.114648 Transcript_48351/m.114648 type:complete len:238 (-) Transcript_48351:75-788(-)
MLCLLALEGDGALARAQLHALCKEGVALRGGEVTALEHVFEFEARAVVAAALVVGLGAEIDPEHPTFGREEHGEDGGVAEHLMRAVRLLRALLLRRHGLDEHDNLGCFLVVRAGDPRVNRFENKVQNCGYFVRVQRAALPQHFSFNLDAGIHPFMNFFYRLRTTGTNISGNHFFQAVLAPEFDGRAVAPNEARSLRTVGGDPHVIIHLIEDVHVLRNAVFFHHFFVQPTKSEVSDRK